MEDVATGAGMPRQYLYRFVSGREELVELALLERCREFSEELVAQAEALNGDLEADLVEILVACVIAGREDSEFAYLAESIPRARLSELLTSSASPMHRYVGRSLAPVLDRAREAGRLRTDVDEDAIVDWLQGVMTFLTPREDLGPDALRTMMSRFTIPSVLDPR